MTSSKTLLKHKLKQTKLPVITPMFDTITLVVTAAPSGGGHSHRSVGLGVGLFLMLLFVFASVAVVFIMKKVSDYVTGL